MPFCNCAAPARLHLNTTDAVRIDANGQTYTWSFHTVAGPP